jgi:CrcB protein
MLRVVLVALGAAIGAPSRYLIDRAVTRAIRARQHTKFPWGTLAANLAGCTVLGALAGAAGADPTLPAEVSALVGTGFCGALTTYSTFGYETVRLAREGDRTLAVAVAVVSLTAGLGATAIGYLLAQALVGP